MLGTRHKLELKKATTYIYIYIYIYIYSFPLLCAPDPYYQLRSLLECIQIVFRNPSNMKSAFGKYHVRDLQPSPSSKQIRHKL